MYGCPYELIFNSAHLLPKLRRDPRFAYRPGVIVQRVVETGEGVAVCGIDKATGRPLRFAGQRAYLGAGVVNSTRIVLESLEAYDTPLEMADSCYFLVPWVTARGSRAVTSEPLHTLAQLFFEILDPAISTHTVHLQLYTYNDLYIGAIRKLLGPAYRALRPLLDGVLGRLHILQGYLHSTESPSIQVRLTGRGDQSALVLTSRGATREHRARIGAVLSKLWRHRRHLGGCPIAPMLNIADPGRGFHGGGTIPMRREPRPFQCDILGRPYGFRRLHLVDATAFPTIPATTITLSVMANAHRIGSASP